MSIVQILFELEWFEIAVSQRFHAHDTLGGYPPSFWRQVKSYLM